MPHVYNFIACLRTEGVVKAGFKIAASRELCRVLVDDPAEDASRTCTSMKGIIRVLNFADLEKLILVILKVPLGRIIFEHAGNHTDTYALRWPYNRWCEYGNQASVTPPIFYFHSTKYALVSL